MQYAMVNGTRNEAFKGATGLCPLCNAPVVAKCGGRVAHHWAHARTRLCDPWWENETDWHRAWKNKFPEACREISHVAQDGEIHRADIKTATGIVIEIQNSVLSDKERKAREAFYGNMAWVINGAAFRNNFHILHCLPDPASSLAQDLVWFRVKMGEARGLFWRRSENLDYLEGRTGMVEVHGIHEIEKEVGRLYRGHHQYDWVRPRRGWLESGRPVYLDFHDDWLWRLDRYGVYGLPCIQAVAKQKFIRDANTESRAIDIAARFYPII